VCCHPGSGLFPSDSYTESSDTSRNATSWDLAQTGTGQTAAFVLRILQRLDKHSTQLLRVLITEAAIEENYTMSKKIFVGNLPFSMGEAELRGLFEQKGTVDSITVMRDFATGRSRGFAFVEMASDEEAGKAIKELNAFSADGRNLTVNEARPKTERRGGFGQGTRGGMGSNRGPRW
jgi:cold-inducible RNA-binding protein